MQHVNGPPRGWFSVTNGACHRGGPPSSHSKAVVCRRALRALALTSKRKRRAAREGGCAAQPDPRVRVRSLSRPGLRTPQGRLADNRTEHPDGRTLMDLLVLLIIVLIILSVAGGAFVSPLVLVLLVVALLLFVGPYRGRRGRL